MILTRFILHLYVPGDLLELGECLIDRGATQKQIMIHI